MPFQSANRRQFLFTAFGTAAAACALRSGGEDAIKPTNPRATDGDMRHEPDWTERLTVRVGIREGDMSGNDDKVIQAALDYVARLGGGTVQVLPGTYTLRNAVFLPSGVRLCGSGADSIITKIPSQSIPLADDSDWYDQEITLKSGGDFRVGDGVLLRAKNPHNGGSTVIKRSIVARSGNRFKLNDGLRENLWLSGTPIAASLFPLLTSENTRDVVIENLTLDGNRANNENLDGNYGGCVFLQDCNAFTIRNVTARNNNGDGISFQICHDVLVENCHSHDNADLGVHPGSGSQRPRVIGNRLERNGIGLFWCWGVKYGLAEKNRIDANSSYGISVGHNDTDNVMRDNDVTNSGKVGILFRDEPGGKDFWANRNTVEGNRITNSGGEDGIAIDVQGQTKDLRVVGNTIRETRGPAKRIAIRLAQSAGAVEMKDNVMEGFAQDLLDQRKA